jgi:hypothetical protein
MQRPDRKLRQLDRNGPPPASRARTICGRVEFCLAVRN